MKLLNSIAVILITLMLVTSCGTANPTEVSPTDTSKPTNTPKPTNVPKPTNTPKPTPTPKPITLSDNEIWVKSYPTGAKVYLIPAIVDLDTLELDDVIKPKNLMGVAPLTYELPVGTYYVALVYTPELYDAKLPVKSDPTFDQAFPFDSEDFQTMTTNTEGKIISLAKLYTLTKGDNSSSVLTSIALPLPKAERGQSKPFIYPTFNTVKSLSISYKVNDSIRQSINETLTEYKMSELVDSSLVDDMLQVLWRTGKIKLDTEPIRVNLWIHDLDSTTFTSELYENNVIPTRAPNQPELADDKVWINSYPVGAKVYLTVATVDINDLKLDDVIQPKNFIGAAPLTYELPAGEYYVVTVFSPKLYGTTDLPTYSDKSFNEAFPFEGERSRTMNLDKDGNIDTFSKIYTLSKNAGNSAALISVGLPLPENQRGLSKPVLYPTLATVKSLPISYQPSDNIKQSIRENLKKYKLSRVVDSGMVDEMLEVLLRVGKVQLDADEIKLIIWMDGTDTTGYTTQLTEK